MTTVPVQISDIPVSLLVRLEKISNSMGYEVRCSYSFATWIQEKFQRVELSRSVLLAYLALRDIEHPKTADFLLAIHAEIPLVSMTDASKIAYLRTPDQGPLDRWTVCPVGRWINRHAPGIFQGRAMDTLVSVHARDAHTLGWISTTGEMVEFMENSRRNGWDFGSCMTGDRWAVHPYTVFQHRLGWQIATLSEGETIVARCLVNDSAGYVRIYGNSSRTIAAMGNALADLGIHQADGWDGCRIAVVRRGSRLIGPYLDGDTQTARMSDDDETLIIDPNGEYGLSDTDGFVEDDHAGMVLTEDGNWIDEDEAVNIGGEWFDRDDCFCCEHCDEWLHSDDSHTAQNRRGYDVTLCEGCLESSDFCYIVAGRHSGEYWTDERAVYSEMYDGYLLDSDAVETDTGDWILKQDGAESADGRIFHIGDMVTLTDGRNFPEWETVTIGSAIYALEDTLRTADGRILPPDQFRIVPVSSRASVLFTVMS